MRDSLLLITAFAFAAVTESIVSYSWIVPAAALNVGFLTTAMAHGAVDPWQLLRLGRKEGRWKPMVFYSSILVFAAMFLLLFPTIAVAVFLLAAGFHFGHEDLQNQQSQLANGLAIVARGMVVVGFPIAVHWNESFGFFHNCIATINDQSVASTTSLFAAFQEPGSEATAGARAALLTLTVAPHAALLVTWAHRYTPTRKKLRPDRHQLVWWVETAVLVFCGLLMHPLFFIGLYLAVWHSVKSTIHCLAQTRPGDRSMTTFAAFGATLPIWAFVLYLWIRSQPFQAAGTTDLFFGVSANSLAAYVFLSYAVVTLPHLWWHPQVLSRKAAHPCRPRLPRESGI